MSAFFLVLSFFLFFFLNANVLPITYLFQPTTQNTYIFPNIFQVDWFDCLNNNNVFLSSIMTVAQADRLSSINICLAQVSQKVFWHFYIIIHINCTRQDAISIGKNDCCFASNINGFTIYQRRKVWMCITQLYNKPNQPNTFEQII